MFQFFLSKAIPYLVLSIAIFAVNFLFGDKGSVAFGFAFLVFVLVLWRPQFPSQIGLAYFIGFVLFALPFFSHDRFFLGLYISHSFRYHCFESALCLNLSLAVPLILRFGFGACLVRDGNLSGLEIAKEVTQLTIRDLLFSTFCIALLVCFANSIAMDFAGRFQDSAAYFQWIRAVTVPVLVQCLIVSTTTGLCFLAFSANRERKFALMVAVFAVTSISPILTVLASDGFQVSWPLIHVPARSLLKITLRVLIQTLFAIGFPYILHLLGFRLVLSKTPRVT